MDNRLETLTRKLNEAARAYYNGEPEIMSDREYDALYDELLMLESKLNTVLEDSPTRRVGYEVVSALEKSEHLTPALSLNKTKDENELIAWLGEKTGVLSWKMDGLTVVATYEGGKLVSAVTRGNGYVGEIITHNARRFAGLPQEIPEKRHLEVRGEAVIYYEDFEAINNTFPPELRYKNPRNLASGSVRLLDAKVCATRKVRFTAFTLVNARELGIVLACNALEYLHKLGFGVVGYSIVTGNDIKNAIFDMKTRLPECKFPTDGLVLTLNDLVYGEELGTTGKYPRNAIAFKWQDDTETTTLKGIEWSGSRTGRLNPVAVFEPVEIEGTTVSRASLHNVSVIKDLKPGVGDRILVYKANMIIPQVAENLDRTGSIHIPDTCPVCGAKTEIRTGADGSEFLYCSNPECAAKQIGKFEHFVKRDGMDIAGLSTETLEKLINASLLHWLPDIFHLHLKKERLLKLPGLGEASVNSLLESIEKSRHTTFRNFITALGIPGIGKDVARMLDRHFSSLSEGCRTYWFERMACGLFPGEIDGIGPVKRKSMKDWYQSNRAEYDALLRSGVEITDDRIVSAGEKGSLEGKTLVITGSLHQFANRDELVRVIESAGGKASGSVSSKTDYLVNNDPNSSSGKNRKAKELGIPIISEEELLDFIQKS